MKYLLYIFLLTTYILADIEIKSDDINVENFKLEYYIEKNNSRDISSIKNKVFQEGLNKKSFGNKNNNIWFRVNVSNKSSKKQTLYFYNSTAFKSSFMQYYEFENEKLLKHSKYDFFENTGNKELINGSISTYKFTLDVNSTKTIYLQNINMAYHYVAFMIYDNAHVQKSSNNSVMILGFQFGFLIALLIYNFVLYFNLKYKEYLYYSLYLLCATVWMLYSYGVVAESFEIYGDTAARLLHGLMLIPLFLALFLKTIFQTKEKYKLENALLNSLIVASVLLNIYTLFDIFSGMRYITYVSQYTVFCLAVVAISMQRKGDKSAKFLLIGHTFFIIFSIIAVLFYAGKIEYNYFTVHSFGIGILLEAAFLSYLLAHRIRLLENSKNDLLNNLEEIVSTRTNELNTTIKNLTLAQKQLVESEKMSSLGVLVAGVAHEVNTPLGVCIVGTSNILSKTNLLNTKFNDQTMSKTDLNNYLTNTTEALYLVDSNLEKAANLIKSFKLVAVDQGTEDKRNFLLNEYINKILTSLQNITKKTNLDIKVKCEDNIELYSYPGSYSQIFTNLIMNSIIHGFKEKEVGNILIEIYVKNDNVHITYEDDGKGISDETYSKIFDPFFTTNRKNGGSGLGMHIIYNIVTSKLNGTITCEYKSRKGIRFNIKVAYI